MGAIGISEGYREVTVVDYSPNEDRSDFTTAGCAWKIAEEAAAVNHITVEEEFDWLLEHNPDVARHPDLVQPGQKVRVQYLKDGHEFAGVGKGKEGEGETGVPLRIEKDGKLSDTPSKDLVSYRHPIKGSQGSQGSYVQVPVNKGSKGGDDNITEWDEGKEHKIKPGDSYTTSAKEIVRNFPGEEYAVTRGNGETFFLNPKAEVREAQDKNSQAYKAIGDLKNKYKGNEKGIDDLDIRMAAEKVDDATQAKILGTYGKSLEKMTKSKLDINEQEQGKIINLLGSKDFHKSFYTLSGKAQNETLDLLLKYAKGGKDNAKKFDSVSRIVKNKNYQGMAEDKQVRLLTEYDKDSSFAKRVDESLDKKNPLEDPIKTIDVLMPSPNPLINTNRSPIYIGT